MLLTQASILNFGLNIVKVFLLSIDFFFFLDIDFELFPNILSSFLSADIWIDVYHHLDKCFSLRRLTSFPKWWSFDLNVILVSSHENNTRPVKYSI